MNRVFVYETLRSLSTLSHVVGEEPKHSKAKALDVKKTDKGDGYFTLERADHSTEGLLVSVTDKELEKLDRWEDRYKRVPVGLDDDQDAWAYVLKDGSNMLSKAVEIIKSSFTEDEFEALTSGQRDRIIQKAVQLAKGGPGSGRHQVMVATKQGHQPHGEVHPSKQAAEKYIKMLKQTGEDRLLYAKQVK